VVSELATNAVQAHRREHLTEPIRLTLLAGLRTVLIAVRDASASQPASSTADSNAEHGRGLFIVEALAAAWSWKPAPGGGKTVRVLLRPARKKTG
jgi:anti-sigma regulatory factor (Ser/Thr protein kinase)